MSTELLRAAWHPLLSVVLGLGLGCVVLALAGPSILSLIHI